MALLLTPRHILQTIWQPQPSPQAGVHPLSRDLIKTSVYFPEATAITPKSTPPTNMTVEPLVWTTTDSWMDNNYDPTTTPNYDPAADTKGSFAIGVIIAPT